jgi:tetratricopeptide (TPR) repeat protein
MHQLLFDVAISSKEDKVQIENAVLAVKNWFYGRKGRWLLVFDGADSVDNENDDSFVDIQHYIPNSPYVDVIITTRSASAKGIASLEAIEVAEMEITEATTLFSKAAKLDPKKENEATVEEIVSELGRLALAINLAGTYISNTPRLQWNLRQYLDEYRERRKELLSQKPTRLVHQYGQSVLTTWETTFSAIAHRCVEASKFLTLLAFVNFDDIFTDLFISVNKDHDHDQQRDDETALAWYNWVFEGKEPDIYAVEEYFGILQLYALVQWKRDQMSYSMHKLVHAWTYDRLDMEDLRGYGFVSLGLLLNALSKTSKEPKQKQRLVQHVMANFATVSKIHYSDSTKETTLLLLARSGDFLTHVGRWTDSYSIRKFVYSEMCVLRGDDYPGTISTMSGLAWTLHDQGKLEEAAAMKKEVLEKGSRILGEEHLNTISAMSNLAITLGYQGKLEEAAVMRREVLEKRRRILGEEHPDTILAMNNLANTLGHQGKLDEAAAMLKETYNKMTPLLGNEHPKSRVIRKNLVRVIFNRFLNLLVMLGPTNREELYGQTLHEFEQAFGPEHASTLLMAAITARVYERGDRLDKAEKMYQRALQGSEKALTPEDTYTLNLIGQLYILHGRLRDAEEMYQRALQGYEKALGPEHTLTRDAICRLYEIYFQHCIALRQEQTARLLSNMVNSNKVKDLSDTLVGLTDLCDRFGAVRPSLFGLLGRVLIWARREDDAIVAFIHQFRLAKSKPEYGGTICDSCGKQLNAGMSRFVCKACMDIDLCDECHENYEIDGLLLREARENCQAHPFLAVPREEKRIWVPEPGLQMISRT